MALRVRLRDNIWLLLITLSACNMAGKVNLPLLNAEGVETRKSKGVFYVNEQPFSGTLFQLFPNSIDTVYVQSYLEGKANGIWLQYYPGHKIKEKRYFSLGSKEGEHIGWWPNGQKKFQYHLQDDIYEGNNREWNPKGQLISDMNYHEGQEDGSQKRWYDNGKIKANYVIRNGRRYGLLGTKNCINVSDSIFNIQ